MYIQCQSELVHRTSPFLEAELHFDDRDSRTGLCCLPTHVVINLGSNHIKRYVPINVTWIKLDLRYEHCGGSKAISVHVVAVSVPYFASLAYSYLL